MQSIRIEANTALSKEEIEKLKNEAAQHAAEDKKKKEMAEAKNQADNLIYASEKAVKDAGDKIPSEVKEAIAKKVEAVKAVKDGQDVEAIKGAVSELSTEIQKIGKAMHGNPPAGGSTGEQPGK